MDNNAPTSFDLDMTGATDTEREAARLAGEDAFNSVFSDDAPARAAADEGKPTPAAPAAPAPAPAVDDKGQPVVEKGQAAPTPAPAAAPAAAEDHFAGLPEAARKVLSGVPQLENDLRETKGRVSTLQRGFDEQKREADRLRAELAESRRVAAAPAPAAPAAAPTIAALELVRGQLPEVASAIEEVVKAHMQPPSPPVAAPPAPAAPAAAPTAAAPPADIDQDSLSALTAYDEKWAVKLHSEDFNLHLMTLPANERQKIQTTDNAAVVIAALTKFDRAQAAQREAVQAAQGGARDVGQRRSERVERAAQPRGAGAPPPPAQQSAEDAFLEGFNR